MPPTDASSSQYRTQVRLRVSSMDDGERDLIAGRESRTATCSATRQVPPWIWRPGASRLQGPVPLCAPTSENAIRTPRRMSNALLPSTSRTGTGITKTLGHSLENKSPVIPILHKKHSMPHLTEGSSSKQGVLACQTCKARIASRKAILSWSFRGWHGRAALFRSAFDSVLVENPPTLQLMDTGAHTIQEVSCRICDTKLGWKIIRAHEWPEKWKEGNIVLELSLLEENAGSPLKQELKSILRGRSGSVQDLSENYSHRQTSSDVSRSRVRPSGPRSHQSMYE
ncbi:hypothetical protein K474DRAFT_1698203, partial [Panus rudis PR-1116 ss-1]